MHAKSRWSTATLLALLLCVLCASCAAEAPFVWARSYVAQKVPPERVRLRRGDTVLVFVRDQRELTSSLTVAEDGAIQLALIGRVVAEGRTPLELARVITERLSGVIQRAQVTVTLEKAAALRVSALGEVRRPGVYEVPRGAGVLQALALAGGLTEFADGERIFVLRRGSSLVRVRFRFAELEDAEEVSNRFELCDGDVLVAQ